MARAWPSQWRLYVAEGEVEVTDLEQAIAADLAANAVSDPEVLDHTVTRAEQTIADPWLRALATERLELARHLAGGGGLPSPPGALNVLVRRDVRLMALLTAFGLALAAAATRNHLLLVVFTLSVAAVGMGHGEARRRQRLLVVLCEKASAPPPRGPVLIPEFSVVAALASLTSSRRRVLARAISLVAARRGARARGGTPAWCWQPEAFTSGHARPLRTTCSPGRRWRRWQQWEPRCCDHETDQTRVCIPDRVGERLAENSPFRP
ncbi:MAG TPA: hypothetical protein VGR26_12155 [Acidimicrobiales bacterium]|nr:hypothetical protein [Acidimicrobiales bacterium]